MLLSQNSLLLLELGLSCLEVLFVCEHLLLQIVDDLKNVREVSLLQFALLGSLEKVLKLIQRSELLWCVKLVQIRQRQRSDLLHAFLHL